MPTQVAKGAEKTIKRMHDKAESEEEKQRWLVAAMRLKQHWSVIVVESEQVNAFVHPLLPGCVFFLTGLVGPESDLTDDEVAMVCAHELSHALLGHGKEGLEVQSTATALKIIVLSVLDPTGLVSLLVEVCDCRFSPQSRFGLTDWCWVACLCFSVGHWKGNRRRCHSSEQSCT